MSHHPNVDPVFDAVHRQLEQHPDWESISITVRRHPDGSFEGARDITRIDPGDLRWPQNLKKATSWPNPLLP